MPSQQSHRVQVGDRRRRSFGHDGEHPVAPRAGLSDERAQHGDERALKQPVSVVLPALFGAVTVNAERDESTMISLDDRLLASAPTRSRQTGGDEEGDIAQWGPDGDDLPVDGYQLSVSENAVQIGARHAVGPTKRRKARSVPVPTFVLDELSVQCAGKNPGDLVFGSRDGGYLLRPKSSNGWFRRAVKAAGTQAITPHDLRHTCASLAVSAGVNVLALQRMLGHQSAKVTLDTYADLFDADLDAVSATLHTRYSPENVGKMWAQGELEGSQQASESRLPAQTQSQHRCGRRDSNPHALSSTGT